MHRVWSHQAEAIMSDTHLPSNELLACPFCGAHGMLAETNGAGHETYYTVLCAGDCECDVGYFPIEHEARAAWNMRAPHEPFDELERYKRALYQANGMLIQLDKEPVKLDYSSVTKGAAQ
jgi:hypothetical protein